MDPASIRFTTVDPHSERYYSSSPYVYVGNNPMRFTDSDGKDGWDKILGFIAAVADKCYIGNYGSSEVGCFFCF